jgi:hypothetical protein
MATLVRAGDGASGLRVQAATERMQAMHEISRWFITQYRQLRAAIGTPNVRGHE